MIEPERTVSSIQIVGVIDSEMHDFVFRSVTTMPATEELVITLSSHGGDFDRARDIFYALKLLAPAKRRTVHLRGPCFSGAAIVAMAGERRVWFTGQTAFQIHNAATTTTERLTASKMATEAEHLREADEWMLDLFAKRTGADAAIIKAAMDQDEGLSLEWCLEHRFATHVMEFARVA